MQACLPHVIFFRSGVLGDEPEINTAPKEECTCPDYPIWLHCEGKQLTPATISKHILNVQANRWLTSWKTKRVQGIILKCNPHTLEHTAYFFTSNTLEPKVKMNFFMVTMDLLPTLACKFKWGYVAQATCMLCKNTDMNYSHIFTVCPRLGAFYKGRHNKVLDRIATELVKLENANIAFVDAS